MPACLSHIAKRSKQHVELIQPRARFFTITLVTVRPGHEREFERFIDGQVGAAEGRAADNRVV